MKLSEVAYKRTIPGIQQVARFYDEAGCPVGDVICDETMSGANHERCVDVLDAETSYDFAGHTCEDLLVPVVAHGERVGGPEGIEDAKRRCRDALMHLDPAVRRFLNPQVYPVGIETELSRLRQRLVREERAAQAR